MEQGGDRFRKVAGVPAAALLGPVNGPSERRAAKVSVDGFERRLESKDQGCQFSMTVEGSPVQRGGAVLAARFGRPTCSQHQADRVKVAILSGIHELALFSRPKTSALGPLIRQNRVFEFPNPVDLQIVASVSQTDASIFRIGSIGGDFLDSSMFAETLLHGPVPSGTLLLLSQSRIS